MSNLLITDYTKSGAVALAEYGGSFIFFATYIVLYLILVFIILFLQYKKASGIIKQQIIFLFWGIILSALYITIMDLLLPIVFKNDIYANFGPFGIIFLVSFATYAILKHHLFAIKVIATEALVLAITTILFIQTLLSKTLMEGLVRTLFLILVAYFGYLLVKSVIDEIERRKQIEKLTKQLEQANLHLQELDKLKSEFVSIASHDLLTPVAAIEGYLSMIIDEKLIRIKNKRLADILDRIYGSSRRLSRLIADLLNISRIEEGRLYSDKKPQNIQEIIEAIMKELTFHSDKHHLYLRFDRHAHEIPKVYVDSDQIKEALTNLIGNAIKFTRSGGVTISVEILPTQEVENEVAKLEHSIREESKKKKTIFPESVFAKSKDLVGEKQIVIHIRDTGIGIPNHELPSLFQKFYRGAGWRVKDIQGTGLGLYISKSIVELHNGRIWVNSKDGIGSDFAFSLPLASEAELVNKIDHNKNISDQEIKIKPLAKGPMREI